MEAIKHGYQENRRILIEGLPKAGLTKFLPADGAFYLYADVSDFTSDSFAFASEMLEKAHVAATPGVDFDPIHGRAFIRFSYARSAEDMREAVAPHRALACIARRNPSPDICRYKPQLERFPCPPARCQSPSLSSIFHSPQCSGRTGPMEFPRTLRAVILVALGTALLTLVRQGQSAAAIRADDAADAGRADDRRGLWLASRLRNGHCLSGGRGDRISGICRSSWRPCALVRSDRRISLRLRAGGIRRQAG